MLAYPMANETPLIHHIIEREGLQLYNRGWQKLKWKDLRTSKDETPSLSWCRWGGNKVRYWVRMVTRVWIRLIGWLIRALLKNKPLTSELAPACGARNFRWKLQTCWGNTSRLRGLIMGNWKGQYNGRGKRFYMCMIKGVWKSVGPGPHIHTKGWGLITGTNMCVWFIKIRRGTSGWCMVYMGDQVETRSVVAHDKTNGWWELWRSIKHDELKDMGHLVPMKKEANSKHMPHLLKYYLLLCDNLKSTKCQPCKTKWIKRKKKKTT